MVRKLEIHGRGFSVGCEEFDAGNHHSMKDGMEILTELSFDGSLSPSWIQKLPGAHTSALGK